MITIRQPKQSKYFLYSLKCSQVNALFYNYSISTDKKALKHSLSSDKKRLSTMNEETEKDADTKRQSTQNISQV